MVLSIFVKFPSSFVQTQDQYEVSSYSEALVNSSSVAVASENQVWPGEVWNRCQVCSFLLTQLYESHGKTTICAPMLFSC